MPWSLARRRAAQETTEASCRLVTSTPFRSWLSLQVHSSLLDRSPPGGALIVYDAMIDDDRRLNAFGLLMSLNMLIETPAGFDYTGADCAAWMQEAGFREVRVEPLQGPYSMAVGTKI